MSRERDEWHYAVSVMSESDRWVTRSEIRRSKGLCGEPTDALDELSVDQLDEGDNDG